MGCAASSDSLDEDDVTSQSTAMETRSNASSRESVSMFEIVPAATRGGAVQDTAVAVGGRQVRLNDSRRTAVMPDSAFDTHLVDEDDLYAEETPSVMIPAPEVGSPSQPANQALAHGPGWSQSREGLSLSSAEAGNESANPLVAFMPPEDAPDAKGHSHSRSVGQGSRIFGASGAASSGHRALDVSGHGALSASLRSSVLNGSSARHTIVRNSSGAVVDIVGRHGTSMTKVAGGASIRGDSMKGSRSQQHGGSGGGSNTAATAVSGRVSTFLRCGMPPVPIAPGAATPPPHGVVVRPLDGLGADDTVDPVDFSFAEAMEAAGMDKDSPQSTTETGEVTMSFEKSEAKERRQRRKQIMAPTH
jgi:hypothetical protein